MHRFCIDITFVMVTSYLKHITYEIHIDIQIELFQCTFGQDLGVHEACFSNSYVQGYQQFNFKCVVEFNLCDMYRKV